MAKSKNHTSHTANQKNHRNGIKKPKAERYASTKGMYQSYKANLKYVRQGNVKVAKALKEKAVKATPVKRVASVKNLHKTHNPHLFVRGPESPEQRKARIEKQKQARATIKASRPAKKVKKTVEKK